MKYYRVNNRGDMSPTFKWDGRKKKNVRTGFVLKNQLFTEREFKKLGLSWIDVDEIELKKSQVKLYPSGARYEKGVWF